MPVKSSLAERQALARRHVDSGRNIVGRQQRLIAEIRLRGADSAEAENLLANFERTLAIFEDDLVYLLSRPSEAC